MARASSSSTSSTSQIRDIVGQFVGQLSALIEQDAVSRARDTILSAFAGDSGASPLGKRGRGRPPGNPAGRPAAATVLALAPTGRKRRKAPIQLCPVPGCSNRAAPVFGMVCSKHKDLPKMEIRRYREARRAKRTKDKDKTKTKTKVKRKRRRASPATQRAVPPVVRPVIKTAVA
jgi:hypothetical protein